ncbi:alkaline phosphatase family protein [Parabacteroides sp. PF5-9]|uniref:LTA synthase family protein n=1 Tax=Parabacteroides sp. PF5-9 TaxID=1742404 RepID=UPI002475C4AE|nr:alkaline phosphatase family protein [Parabacteroides sp. PF5-9]MDH6357333.1 phosphoglycerol transferase MdoB-like AlkP superfamily enzyme [Parabacteroides sp. PF5-9]
MKQRILFILAVFVAWLPVFVIQKPVFMLYHLSQTADVSLTEWILVIWNGLKLDCTISGYLTVIPLLATLVSIWLNGSWLQKFMKGYFLVMAILVAIIFAVDVALYGFWGFRLDATVLFYLQSPKDAMASVPVGTFFLQIAVCAIYAFAIYSFFKRLIIPLVPVTKAHQRLLGSLAVILLGGLLFLPIRGGVTTSTANVGMVYFSKNQFLNHAAINPTFSLIASLSKQQDFAAQFDFFPEEKREELFNQLVASGNSSPDESSTLLNTTRPNILIILLESFSANAIEVLGGEAGVTPNLNRLSQEGILFTNLYANSFRTDRGIVSVLNGYLAQPTTSIMKYPAKSQTLPSIARTLADNGYVNNMLYGGDINFTNMQSYFFSSGYSHITADRDFPLSTRLNKWGANDNVTFSWLYDSMVEKQNSPTPWMTTFLTLSSHEPFEVPFHHLEHPYLNSVAFTDSCIGSFIDRLKTEPIWKDLLVVMVSDHGFRYPDHMPEYDPRRYHIPMIWLGGAVKEPQIIDTYGVQTDLSATLLNQLNLPCNEFTFSKDLQNPADPHYVFYTFNNGFGFIDETGLSVFDNEGEKTVLEQPTTGSTQRIEKGKALLQTLYDDMGGR